MKRNYFFVSLFLLTASIFAQGFNQFSPPQNLTGELVDNNIAISWDEPGNGAQWVHWDTTEYETSYGLIQGGTFIAASRMMVEDLEGFTDYYFTKLSFFPTSDTNAEYTIMVWQGENADTLLVSQQVEEVNLGEWNEVTIIDPIQIDVEQELWFGVSVTHEAMYGVIGGGSGSANVGHGAYISLDGENWNEAQNIGFNHNWLLRGFLSFTLDEGKKLGKQSPQLPKQTTFSYENTFFEEKAAVKDIHFYGDKGAKSIFQHYRLIHKVEGSSWDYIADTTASSFVLNNVEDGVHYFMVYCVYEGGESMPEGPFILDTSPDGISELKSVSLVIFPNPTSQYLNIASEHRMKKLLIYNTMGQLVQEKKLDADEYQMDLESLSEGNYFLKVETLEGYGLHQLIISK